MGKEGRKQEGKKAESGIEMPGRRKWEAVEKTVCRFGNGHKMCELQKGKTQNVGRRRREMRNRCGEWEARIVPQRVCLSVS